MANRIRLRLHDSEPESPSPRKLRPGGRPTHLTSELLEEFVGYISEGLPANKACDMVRISEQNMYNWMAWGRAFYESGGPKEHAIYGEFFDRVKYAQAEWQLEIIRRSLSTDKYSPNWVRDMTILERRDRSNWGRDSRSADPASATPDEAFL